MRKRKYTQRLRAERQQETRERIVDAAMALHEELGPAETTVSAVADRAGVQRLTVYRHFATDRALFGACSSKWFSLHTPPDLAAIQPADPEPYTKAVLSALYDYYRGTAGMWSAVIRDAAKMPAVKEVIAGFEAYLDVASKQLLAVWAPRKSAKLKATIAHALRFSTWQSLSEQKLGTTSMAELTAAWVRGAAE
jgi:AcrR family transcriptional regulator